MSAESQNWTHSPTRGSTGKLQASGTCTILLDGAADQRHASKEKRGWRGGALGCVSQSNSLFPNQQWDTHPTSIGRSNRRRRGKGYLGKVFFFPHDNQPLPHFNVLAKRVIQDFAFWGQWRGPGCDSRTFSVSYYWNLLPASEIWDRYLLFV